MSLKKGLMIGVLCINIFLGKGASAYNQEQTLQQMAWLGGVGAGIIVAMATNPASNGRWVWCNTTKVCFWQDPLGAVGGFVLRETNKKVLEPTYDIRDGLRKIEENIGAHQDEGICGVSASGSSGCSQITDEEGEAKLAGAEEAAKMPVIPDSTIAIIEHSEARGEIAFDENSQEADKRDKVAKTGDTFDQVRANVAEYMFVTDDALVNADCQCSDGTASECDPTECAQVRQNNALVVATTSASSVADVYLKEIEGNYDNLKQVVSEVNSADTIAAFVNKLGLISVYASAATVDQMILQAFDLRNQSYRNLIASGIKNVDMSVLNKGGTQ